MVRALCQGLREEVTEMKVENSRLVDEMQKMQEDFGTNMENLRNQLLSAMTEMIQTKKGIGTRELDALSTHSRPLDDEDLIVIGNEFPLVERPVSRMGDIRPITPMPQKAKTQSKEKGLMEQSSHPVSEANDTGQTAGRSDMARKGMAGTAGQYDMGRSDMGWKGTGGTAGQYDMGRRGTGGTVGQYDMGWRGTGGTVGQYDMGRNGGQKRRSVQLSDAGQSDMGQIRDEETERRISKAKTLPSDLDVPPEMIDVGEMKDDEIKMRMSKAEALPSNLDGSPEMTSTGEMKDEDSKMSMSKAPPTIQKMSLDGFTASGMHPGAPGIQSPVHWVQSMRGHPGSQNVWTTDRSGAETRRRSQNFPSTMRSPSFSGHLARAFKRHPCVRVPQQRELPPAGYSRRSPLYSGGKHTTTYAVQPMEPLLPDPNKVGMGKVGIQTADTEAGRVMLSVWGRIYASGGAVWRGWLGDAECSPAWQPAHLLLPSLACVS
ncbi:uncharacterized protein LOC117005112 isoform X2 [Catharus ustulatus]|uniref:uncharacterized protein LOC117005112 isoform X2 n=1 Tax=Catharus ustulatus TaxID=91951 RepID=UPI00140DC8DF|nr:uncharacterized protein LOC117005112 isoform X2 [Catharus ustulatus]